MVATKEANAAALEHLEPAVVWQAFGQLANIPRPSFKEQKVQEFLREFAAQRGLSVASDATGNMVIKRPGSGGGEAAQPVIIQGHLDMVCEKNADVQHSFESDPIRLKKAGAWLKADGTTLGADNGLGVAVALAVLDSPNSAKLPPIEALFTVAEEVGLVGAFALDGSLLSGRTLLNLDTEEAGEIYIGCAGGGDSELLLPVQHEAVPAGSSPVRVVVSGLKGGHSGLNIADGRGNANKLLSLAAAAILAAQSDARLVSLQGGDKRNALAREASAILAVPTAAVPEVQQLIAAQLEAAVAEYGTLEDQLSISATAGEPAASDSQALAPEAAERLLSLLLVLPHGVEKMSHAVEGLVETSNNLASVAPAEHSNSYRIVLTTRSSIKPALAAQRDRIARAGRLVGASVKQNPGYPGWTPDPSSKLVQLTKEVFTEVNGKVPSLKAIHAGLECGILGERLPGCDMVSYGPTITGAHSPDEQVEIATVQPFWTATLRILERLADRTA